MAKGIINLKQHTPMIHFQADQEGATIRGTELKSKLDRFIITKLEFIDKDLFIDYKKYVDELEKSIKEKSNSLYKIKVYSTIKEKIKHGTSISNRDIKKYQEKNILTISKVPYFGDNVSLNFEDLRLEIFSYDVNMTEFISKVIPKFLVIENFGSRQNKGFGSFADDNIIEDDFENILISHEKMLRKENYNIYKYVKKGVDNPLQIIQNFYQKFKSGTNKPYVKSKLCTYMKDQKSIRWEKRKIKKVLNEDKYKNYYNHLKDDHKNDIKSSEEKKEKEEYKFIRAMLGLSEKYEFITDDKNKKYVFTVTDSKREIERFQSPIFFKVFENNIYMIIRSIPNELYDREFNVSFSTKTKKSRNKTEIKSIETSFLKINTPKEKEFDLDEIIKNYAKEFGFSEVKKND